MAKLLYDLCLGTLAGLTIGLAIGWAASWALDDDERQIRAGVKDPRTAVLPINGLHYRQ